MGNVTPLSKVSAGSQVNSGMRRVGNPSSFEKSTPRIEDMPRDVGWLLVTAGLIGEMAPGVIGTPFWIMGSLILWPRTGKRVESWLESHAPELFRGGMGKVWRFLDDLDRRYPRVKANDEESFM